MNIFLHYILPALMLGLLVLKLSFSFGKERGPFALAMIFLSIAFGPSLFYALIADESSIALFCISVFVALIVTGLVLWMAIRKPRSSQLIYIGKNNQKLGPFTIWQIGQKFSTGEISPDDLAWHEGLPDWQPLRVIMKLDEKPHLRELINEHTAKHPPPPIESDKR